MSMFCNRPGLRRPGRGRSAAVALLTAAVLSAAASQATAVIAYSPAQIQSAYNYSGITFTTASGTVAANGAGQTVAIIVAGSDPNLSADLTTFDTQFTIAPPPSLNVTTQAGTPTTTGLNAFEELLDVEWVHALAPAANIDVVESTGSQFGYQSAQSTAASLTNVSVVTMTYGFPESTVTASSADSYYTTPGITYISGSGDMGTPTYPGTSPYVLSVGATSLLLNASNKISSETVWNSNGGSSGGGPSTIESEPSYQSAVQSTGSRTAPDVAFDGDPNNGLYVYVDNATGPGTAGEYFSAGGTSAGVPGWAALIALADQGRVANGLGTLTSSDLTNDGDGTMPLLYALDTDGYYSEAFNDITSGDNQNGVYAGVGYDEVTGLGSPNASFLVPYLAGFAVPEPATVGLLLMAAPLALRRRRRPSR